MSRVGIVGGGLIGLSVAFEALRRGHEVTLVDQARAGWATWAAAGILAPDTASSDAERQRALLHRRSAEMYPDFVAAVEAASGLPVDYRRCGSLVVGSTAALDAFARQLEGEATSAERIDGYELRSRAPGLDAAEALWVEADALVDPRRLHTALAKILVTAGVRILNAAAEGIAPGLIDLAGGRRIEVDELVVTVGAWTNRLLARPDVTPVKGQTIIVESESHLTDPCVLGLDTDPHVYVARRSETRYIVAATVEDAGFDTRVTAGAVARLLQAAASILPGIADAELIEATAGLRPGADRPAIGRVDRVLVATGHHRNGILLAPITAATIGALLDGTAVPEEAVPFAP